MRRLSGWTAGWTARVLALAAGSALAEDTMGKKDSMGMKKDSMAKKKPMKKKPSPAIRRNSQKVAGTFGTVSHAAFITWSWLAVCGLAT